MEKLESAGFKYMTTGSVAAIFYGEPRLTHDIDIVIHLDADDVKKFERLFPLAEYYCPPEEVILIEMRRRPYGHFSLIHHSTGFKADIYLEGGDELHKWAFERTKRIVVSEGRGLFLAPPEYLIIRKLEFYREGKSSKHLQDISNILPQVKDQLDMAFLNDQLKKRGLEPFWHS
ncbi:MAG: hypothetical protein KDD59_08620 [Bdellovibrionales bacterium]|nr:hypothetical protein [Bdellovibrionales bacterium]